MEELIYLIERIDFDGENVVIQFEGFVTNEKEAQKIATRSNERVRNEGWVYILSGDNVEYPLYIYTEVNKIS